MGETKYLEVLSPEHDLMRVIEGWDDGVAKTWAQRGRRKGEAKAPGQIGERPRATRSEHQGPKDKPGSG